MSHGPAWSYARMSGLVAALALVALVLAAARGLVALVPWAVVGWLVPASVGIGGGAVLAARHGSAGPGFLIALVVCILSRLALAVGGALAATTGGGVAVRAFLIGLVVGFLPLQVFEVAWFYRGPRGSSGRHDS